MDIETETLAQNQTMRLWRSFPTWPQSLDQEHLERNTRHLEGTRIARSAAMLLGDQMELFHLCPQAVQDLDVAHCCTKENDHFRPAQFFQVSAMHDATSCTLHDLHVFEAEWKHTSSTRTGRHLIKLICFEACNALIATVLYKRMQ